MALFARYGCMLFYEGISGEAMIELLQGRVPMDQRKILSIMFEMAAHAILAIGILHAQ
jgi:hypothetical protein